MAGGFSLLLLLLLLISLSNSSIFRRPFYFLVDYEVEAFEISDTGELNYTYPKHRGGVSV